MTTRAVDLARITGKYVEAYDVDRGICHVAWCVHPVVHRHHVMARAALAGAYDWLEVDGLFLIGNLVGLCVQHHDDIHSGKASILLAGRAWEFDGDGRRGFLNPRAPVRTLTEGECASQGATPEASPSVSVPPGQDCPHVHLEPGQKCACGYRKKHPQKRSSPKTQPFHFHVPTDDLESFEVALNDRGERMGIIGKKYWLGVYLDVTFQIVDSLDDETLRRLARERAEAWGLGWAKDAA